LSYLFFLKFSKKNDFMPDKTKMKIGKAQETRNEAISCVFLVFSSMKIGKAKSS